MNVLRVSKLFGENTTSKEELGKALLQICILSLVAFVTEALPIKSALNKDFISLFCKPKQQAQISPHKEAAINISSVSTSVDSRATADSLTAEPSRMSFKEYAARKMSVGEVTKLIKNELLSSKDVQLKTLFSSGGKKLGAIYKAEAKLGKTNMQLAARTITFNKLPTYLLETIYLELAYTKENTNHAHTSVTPTVGLVCERGTLTFLAPWHKESLSQFIHGRVTSAAEKLGAAL